MVLGLLLAASVAIPTYLTYHYGWGAVGQGTSTKNFMTWFYFKPWNRFSPYMVGILLGYVLHVTKSKPFKMPQVTKFSWKNAIEATSFVIHNWKNLFQNMVFVLKPFWKSPFPFSWNAHSGESSNLLFVKLYNFGITRSKQTDLVRSKLEFTR